MYFALYLFPAYGYIKASTDFGVRRSTLRDRVKKIKSKRGDGKGFTGFTTVLSINIKKNFAGISFTWKKSSLG